MPSNAGNTRLIPHDTIIPYRVSFMGVTYKKLKYHTMQPEVLGTPNCRTPHQTRPRNPHTIAGDDESANEIHLPDGTHRFPLRSRVESKITLLARPHRIPMRMRDHFSGGGVPCLTELQKVRHVNIAVVRLLISHIADSIIAMLYPLWIPLPDT